MDKVSYALGIGIGHQLANMGGQELNIDDFAQAVKDVLGGKEWMFGSEKQNVFALSAKVTVQGGDRHAPVADDVTPYEIIHS